MVDLHVHSTCSDGTFTPEELVDYAIQKGLTAFALTDHDTVNGLDRAIRYADGLRQAQAASPSDAPASQVPEVSPVSSYPQNIRAKISIWLAFSLITASRSLPII